MKPVSDGGKKDSRRKAAITADEFASNWEHAFKPRMNHANTLAYGDDDKAPLMQPAALDE